MVTLRTLLNDPPNKARNRKESLKKLKVLSDHVLRPGYSSDSQFACRHCGKRYRWKSTMRRHEQVECGGKEPSFYCPHCPYRAKQKELPVKIELTEVKIDNWQGWTAENETKPKKTTYNRIKGNFICIQCSRMYVRKDSLQRHLTYECGKEPQFQCPFCPQKCKRKTHQMRHIQRQHKDKIGLLEENNPDISLSKQNPT
ncbi:hypothetical protein Trydic_g17145 [Trypoxylus dichotomus]